MHLNLDVGSGEQPTQQLLHDPEPLPLSYEDPRISTAQEIISSTASTLSHRLHSFLDPTTSLPSALHHEVRAGAGSSIVGYARSQSSSSLQSIIAYTPTLRFLRSSLQALYPARASAKTVPLAIHLIAQDYDRRASLVVNNDYCSVFNTADELGFALVSSQSLREAQDMAVLSSALAEQMPTLHVVDGLSAASATTVHHELPSPLLKQVYTHLKAVCNKSVGRQSPIDACRNTLRALNSDLGTSYSALEYTGHAAPEIVLVVFGSVEATLSSQVADSFSAAGHRVGTINVRIYRPFDEEMFLRMLPSSTRAVAVLGQVQGSKAIKDKSVHSALYQDVLTAIQFGQGSTSGLSVIDVKYPRSYQWSTEYFRGIFTQLLSSHSPSFDKSTTDKHVDLSKPSEPAGLKEISIWDLDRTGAVRARSTAELLDLFPGEEASSDTSINHFRDILTEGGITRIDIRHSKTNASIPFQIRRASFVVVGDVAILKHYDVIKSLRKHSVLLIRIPGFKVDDVEKHLSPATRKSIADKAIATTVFSFVPPKDTVDTLEAERGQFQQAIRALQLYKLKDQEAEDLKMHISRLDVPDSWKSIEEESKGKPLPSVLRLTGFARQDLEVKQSVARLQTEAAIAKSLAFREAYGLTASVRPDLSVRTHQVRVKENRRLTPMSYDRNIFHIEFDLGDSGLTYAIGEALGIHGENDLAEVNQFMKDYNLNPEDIVQVPSLSDPSVLETRTVFQSLMQNVDLFGRPPKKFYESLAEFATDEKERQALLTLTTPDGSTQFKRMAEVDTVTFADILLMNPSAQPSFPDLVQIIPPMKRREYSIASSQKVQPNTVSLLVVVVNWQDPRGRNRYGQCTRYLSTLPIGAPVTVSVKPSVMKLPPLDTQPLIMAGLGTGLAPFRAFCQYRAWQKEQGIKIGSVLLYMGSRHQREEYLYGEEWEAWQDAGVITLLGRAFSRDQKEKIYIQDRMRQTIDDIVQAYLKDEGAFYLCGPTWPVPDVTEVLQEAIEMNARLTGEKVNSKRMIDELKDDGRYVLEVY